MHRELIHLPADTRPILVVVIHTEEEFDWNLPHDRNATGVGHMDHIGRAQQSSMHSASFRITSSTTRSRRRSAQWHRSSPSSTAGGR